MRRSGMHSRQAVGGDRRRSSVVQGRRADGARDRRVLRRRNRERRRVRGGRDAPARAGCGAPRRRVAGHRRVRGRRAAAPGRLGQPRSCSRRAGTAPTSARSWPNPGRAASSPRRTSRATPSVPSSHDPRRGYSRASVTDLVVATPVFLDLTFVGLESLPVLGEERFAAELLRSPGGGAITAVAAARLGLSAAVAAPLGDDVAGDIVRTMLAEEGVEWIATQVCAADADDRGHAVRRRPGDGDHRSGRTRLGVRRGRSRAARGRREPRPALRRPRRTPRHTSRAATTTSVHTRAVRRPRSAAPARCSSTSARRSG